jgi:hypothetical protein
MATIPSLALIPSGYKASKVYSVLPTDGTGDFTFTRSGNATRVNSEGLIELVTTNVPRLNYPLIDGVVQGCPSLLLEPQRINLVQYSEDFSNAYWNKSNSSVTSGFVSPKGDLSAFKLVEDSANSSHAILKSNFPINVQRTLSVFVKKGENERFFISDYNKFGYTIGVIFNLTSGTIESNQNDSIYLNPKIEPYSNGWYRCSVTWTNTTGLTVPFFGNAISGTNSYQGDGVSGIYVFGATFEEASYPTSYIPTSGTIGTRSAETCNNAGDVNTFNDSEGVLFAEVSALANDLTNRYIAISDGTTSNRILFRYFDGLSNSVSLFVVFGGVTQAEINYQTEDIKHTSKFAIKYKVNDFSLWVNGFEVGVDTSGSVPTGLSTLSFSNAGGTLPFYGNTKQIQYFDTALNDSDLETLTSWDSFSDMAIGQLYTIE